MVMMQGVCGCHGDEMGMLRILNELGVAQANEVGQLYLGVLLTGNNEQRLVKVSSGDFTAPFNYLGPYRAENVQVSTATTTAVIMSCADVAL